MYFLFVSVEIKSKELLNDPSIVFRLANEVGPVVARNIVAMDRLSGVYSGSGFRQILPSTAIACSAESLPSGRRKIRTKRHLLLLLSTVIIEASSLGEENSRVGSKLAGRSSMFG